MSDARLRGHRPLRRGVTVAREVGRSARAEAGRLRHGESRSPCLSSWYAAAVPRNGAMEARAGKLTSIVIGGNDQRFSEKSGIDDKVENRLAGHGSKPGATRSQRERDGRVPHLADVS